MAMVAKAQYSRRGPYRALQAHAMDLILVTERTPRGSIYLDLVRGFKSLKWMSE